MSEILTREWENEVKSHYNGPNKKSADISKAFSNRYPELDEYIGIIFDSMKHDANVLLVGVGRDNTFTYPDGSYFAQCASLPFEIAQKLEAHGLKDYRMTILDIDSKALQKANKRKYLISAVLDSEKQNRVRKEIPVSKSFIRKRKSDDIRFVQGDIVIADLGPYGPFDFAHCINIFTHLDGNCKDQENATALALWNIARNLAPGGVLVVDDNHPNEGGTFVFDVMSETGAKMGMKHEKYVHKSNKCSYHFFRKA